MGAAEVIKQEALVNGWTVEPHGYYRHMGVTAVHGMERVSVDMDRMGRILGWVRHTTAGVILGKSGPNDSAKLATAISELSRGWQS